MSRSAGAPGRVARDGVARPARAGGSVASEHEQARAALVAAELAEREVDALLVNTPVNIRYLTAFTGSHGLALLSAAGEPQHRFFTDFRYTTQSAAQVPDSFAREIVAGNLLDAAARSLAGPVGVLGFDEASITVAQHDRLRAELAPGWELRAVRGPGRAAASRQGCGRGGEDARSGATGRRRLARPARRRPRRAQRA